MRRTERPIPQPGLLEIALYQGGVSNLDGRQNVVKLCLLYTSDAADE